MRTKGTATGKRRRTLHLEDAGSLVDEEGEAVRQSKGRSRRLGMQALNYSRVRLETKHDAVVRRMRDERGEKAEHSET